MTDRLYFNDCYLWNFDASVLWRSDDGRRVALDRTAFYPTSGGQPNDCGSMEDIAVMDVIDEGDRILHVLANPLPSNVSAVTCQIDSRRRLDHMRQHTGQHLLSAVLEEEFGLKTVSFHMGSSYSTIDIEPPPASPTLLDQVEKRANERLLENHRVSISFEDADCAIGLRKPPDRQGLIRVVSIEGLDRSACGGTHVHRTGEVGLIALGKTEKIRKALRVDFYCGLRALEFLKGRFAETERQLDQTKSRLLDADKQRRKLGEELAGIVGRRKHAEMLPDALGRKIWDESFVSFSEELLPTMNAFLEGPASIALLTATSDGKVLFGAHQSLGIDCGQRMKAAMAAFSGKGGGSPRSAQGSIPDSEKLPLLKGFLIP